MQTVGRYIEHTILKPVLTDRDIDRVVNEAREFQLFGICVPPFWIKKARREIGNDPVQLVTVIGFPFGYELTESKLDEMQRAVDFGANELDMVLNISAFKSGMTWPKIELAKCAAFAHENGCLLKVIIETAYLDDNEIVEASKICADAGVDFVKTSTGYAPAGAKVEHIKLMRSILPSNVGIKASGGIKTYEDALALIEVGADRIGTSSGVAIVQSAINN